MKRVIGRAMAGALLVSLVVVPVVLMVAQLALGNVAWAETWGGAATGSLFFAVTALATLLFLDSPSLRFAVLSTYVVKTVALVSIGFLVSFEPADRVILALALTVSALSYVVTQSVLVSRGERRLRLGLGPN